MKLKLEEQSGIKILRVTEGVSVKEAQVFKAGALKMLKSGTPCLIAELTAATLTEPAAQAEIKLLKQESVSTSGILIVVSPLPELADVATLDDAVRRATSPLQTLLAQEAQLKARIEKLTQQKKDWDTKLGSSGASNELNTLKREQTGLKKKILNLEKIVKLLAAGRTDPFTSPDAQQKTKSVEDILLPTLSKQGISIG